MKYLIFLFILVLQAPLVISAQQTPCALNLTQAPTLRGFKLGMELKQAFERLPVLKMDAKIDELGHIAAYVVTETLEPPRRDAYKETLNGVEYISLEFKDNKLVRIYVKYDNSVKWNSSQQFALQVSNSLRLPKTWRSYGRVQQLKCDGFILDAALLLSPAVQLRNTKETRTAEEIQAAEEERKRRKFKP